MWASGGMNLRTWKQDLPSVSPRSASCQSPIVICGLLFRGMYEWSGKRGGALPLLPTIKSIKKLDLVSFLGHLVTITTRLCRLQLGHTWLTHNFYMEVVIRLCVMSAMCISRWSTFRCLTDDILIRDINTTLLT